MENLDWPSVGLDRFTLTDKHLGSGTFGGVREGIDNFTGEVVAMKIENEKVLGTNTFPKEASAFKAMNGSEGFPTLRWCGKFCDRDTLVFNLLGRSLSDIRISCSKRLGLKSVLMIGIQMLHRLQDLHSRGFIHNDIKPSNIVVGKAPDAEGKLFLIDLGHCTKNGSRMNSGTLLFSSINMHSNKQASPNDDLESLLYMLVYLLEGTLPWRTDKDADVREESRRIQQLKRDARLTLCVGLPEEFGLFLSYAVAGSSRAGARAEAVDYPYLRWLLSSLMQRAGCEDDGVFQWMLTDPTAPPPLPPLRSRVASLLPSFKVAHVTDAFASSLRAVWRERVNRVTPQEQCALPRLEIEPEAQVFLTFDAPLSSRRNVLGGRPRCDAVGNLGHLMEQGQQLAQRRYCERLHGRLTDAPLSEMKQEEKEEKEEEQVYSSSDGSDAPPFIHCAVPGAPRAPSTRKRLVNLALPPVDPGSLHSAGGAEDLPPIDPGRPTIKPRLPGWYRMRRQEEEEESKAPPPIDPGGPKMGSRRLSAWHRRLREGAENGEMGGPHQPLPPVDLGGPRMGPQRFQARYVQTGEEAEPAVAAGAHGDASAIENAGAVAWRDDQGCGGGEKYPPKHLERRVSAATTAVASSRQQQDLQGAPLDELLDSCPSPGETLRLHRPKPVRRASYAFFA